MEPWISHYLFYVCSTTHSLVIFYYFYFVQEIQNAVTHGQEPLTWYSTPVHYIINYFASWLHLALSKGKHSFDRHRAASDLMNFSPSCTILRTRWTLSLVLLCPMRPMRHTWDRETREREWREVRREQTFPARGGSPPAISMECLKKHQISVLGSHCMSG